VPAQSDRRSRYDRHLELANVGVSVVLLQMGSPGRHRAVLLAGAAFVAYELRGSRQQSAAASSPNMLE
jgi:hypothetical protein